MTNSNTGKLERNLTWLRLIPYAAFGALAFSLTSAANLNYFLRGYLVLLEAQAGIVVIYFLMSKLARINKRNS